MKLGQLAHARSGDKGNHANIGVIARERSDYLRLAAALTAARWRSISPVLASHASSGSNCRGSAGSTFCFTMHSVAARAKRCGSTPRGNC